MSIEPGAFFSVAMFSLTLPMVALHAYSERHRLLALFTILGWVFILWMAWISFMVPPSPTNTVTLYIGD